MNDKFNLYMILMCECLVIFAASVLGDAFGSILWLLPFLFVQSIFAAKLQRFLAVSVSVSAVILWRFIHLELRKSTSQKSKLLPHCRMGSTPITATGCQRQGQTRFDWVLSKFNVTANFILTLLTITFGRLLLDRLVERPKVSILYVVTTSFGKGWVQFPPRSL